MNIDKIKLINYIKARKNVSFIELANYLKINRKDNKEFSAYLVSLIKRNEIFKTFDSNYYVPEFLRKQSGIIKVASKKQFAFLEFENEAQEKESVFVKFQDLNSALNNDEVIASIYKDHNEKNPTRQLLAVVDEIVQRNNQKIIGFIKKDKNTIFFAPADGCFDKVKFELLNLSSKVKINDCVLCEIKKYDKNLVSLEIKKVITNTSDPNVFVKAYLESTNIDLEFSAETLAESKLIPQEVDLNIKEKFQRKNLTSELIVTIDGESTKDFDDAINVKKLENGNFLLSVHIADVAHYVKEKTNLDSEALKRGTSIYIANGVIPMLPSELSNGICSINPNVDRFALSCDIEIDQHGNNVNYKIYKSVINSKFRLTYKQVQAFFDKDNNFLSLEQKKSSYVKELETMLTNAYELSLILHKYKEAQGYVDFEIPEPKIFLNEDGTVKEIKIHKRVYSEILIEDFMVRTNEVVAKYLSDLKMPVLYRIHENPSEEKLQSLKTNLTALGINIKNINSITSSANDFSKFVHQTRNQRNDYFINLLFLRTMQKAIYSLNNIGHFGLASEFYCHFTSPIRRYPDLLVHRILTMHLEGKSSQEILNHFDSKLGSYAQLNSNSEQKAVEIERKVNDLKFAEFLKFQTGKKFKAQIVSVLNFGIFVEFEFGGSGLIHKSNFFDGSYEANEMLTVFASETKSYKIGEYVDVVIIATDLLEGKIDCVLESQYDAYKLNLTRKHEKPRNSK